MLFTDTVFYDADRKQYLRPCHGNKGSAKTITCEVLAKDGTPFGGMVSRQRDYLEKLPKVSMPHES